MSTKTQFNQAGEYLVAESDAALSRASVTLAPTAVALSPGQLLGQVTATGKYVPYASGAIDGSQVAAGILYSPAYASAYDQRVAITARDATVTSDLLVGLTSGARAGLLARRILIVGSATGGDGNETAATGGVVAAAVAPQSAIAIGDSFQQQGWQTSATSSQAFANGWFNHFQWLSQGRFSIAANLGVAGKRMDEVVTEQLPTAISSTAGMILLATAGTNDVTAGRTAAQIIASLQTIFGAAYVAGKKVVALTIPPRGSTSFTGLAFTAPQLAVALAVNNWMRERATFLYPNVVVVDAARRLLDTSSMSNAAAFWVANALTVDGLHPNSQGAIAIAQEAAAAAAYSLPTAKRLASALSTGSAGDLANAFRNAYQIAGGGGTVGAGASGACPQYWGVGRSSGGSNTIAGACSVEARSASFNDGGAGFVTRIDLTGAGAVGDRFTYYPVPVDIVPVAGESWYFAQEIDINFSSGTMVEVLAGGTVLGGATLGFTAGADVGAASWGVAQYRGVLRSRDFVIQAGATGFAFQTDIRTSPGAIGTVRFGQSELRKNPSP